MFYIHLKSSFLGQSTSQDAGKVNKIPFQWFQIVTSTPTNGNSWDLDLFFSAPLGGKNI